MGELKELLNEVLALNTEIITESFENRDYTRAKLTRIPRPEESTPDKRVFETLTGLVEFCNSFTPPIKADEGNLFLHIDTPGQVLLLGGIQSDNFNTRFCYAEAVLTYDSFKFATVDRSYWYDLELFVIQLQAMFVQNDMREAIIDMLGCVANEQVQTHADDGFSKSLQVRTGITTRERQTVKNPCGLRPYRTFREVEQPEGQFILRLRKEGEALKASLWDADGGAWRIAAMASIKAYLEMNTKLKAIA